MNGKMSYRVQEEPVNKVHRSQLQTTDFREPRLREKRGNWAEFSRLCGIVREWKNIWSGRVWLRFPGPNKPGRHGTSSLTGYATFAAIWDACVSLNSAKKPPDRSDARAVFETARRSVRPALQSTVGDGTETPVPTPTWQRTSSGDRSADCVARVTKESQYNHER